MNQKYYNLPLDFEILTKKISQYEEDEAERRKKANQTVKEEKKTEPEPIYCDLNKSILKNIVLIITSKFNEHRYDAAYGCEVWDSDFELISDQGHWKEQVRKSITESLHKFERRLTDINVNTELNEEEVKISQKNLITVKKRLEITIDSTIIKTGENFPFKMKLYISPLSLD